MLSLFLFSSRRRHTRWPRDWSSDVCSSDLRSVPGGRLEVAIMTLRMMWPLWLLLPVFLPLRALTVWKIRASHGERRWGWIRRAAIVGCLLVIGLTPAIPRTSQDALISNVEMFFVVDRTGSMAAEDYDGDQARLVGVRDDLIALTEAMPAARYTIIGFDSQATQQLPMTTDSRAVQTWAETVTQEITNYSAGSSIDRPLDELTRSLTSDRKSTRLNSSHVAISYAVFCL